MNRKPIKLYRISKQVMRDLFLRDDSWEWYPDMVYHRRSWWSWSYFSNLNDKVISFMKNRSFIIGLVFAGLAMQVFTLVCEGALKQGYIDGFNSASIITLFSAFILLLWSQPCSKQRDRDREDMYRDIDAVYRYVDDSARDLRDEISDCSRSCPTQCCKPGKK